MEREEHDNTWAEPYHEKGWYVHKDLEGRAYIQMSWKDKQGHIRTSRIISDGRLHTMNVYGRRLKTYSGKHSSVEKAVEFVLANAQPRPNYLTRRGHT